VVFTASTWIPGEMSPVWVVFLRRRGSVCEAGDAPLGTFPDPGIYRGRLWPDKRRRSEARFGVEVVAAAS